ncbi:hypothetical protein AW736_11365 [Termitidicoccus mucosus]|uniref:Uncharacterized protein n=2 Tax=Termitidicoccus mucosus TaxID=1184151 RepID=A0A178ILA1_9BACT|nr:hypothetical protein AW736_11365 [Opitutaceae bacterium TSB47]
MPVLAALLSLMLFQEAVGLPAASPIRPLANDFVVVGEAADPAKVALYTPSIVRLETGRLVLHFSKNMIDWCFAGLAAVGPSPKQARHYASMDMDGDDLVILSRSGDARAKSAHDGNLITFHRVRNFRDLVY